MRKKANVEQCVLGDLIDNLTRCAGIDSGVPSLVLVINPEFGSGTEGYEDVDVVKPVGSHPLSARLQAQQRKLCRSAKASRSPDSKERQVYS